jgi:hypothetical protein
LRYEGRILAVLALAGVEVDGDLVRLLVPGQAEAAD